MKKLCGPTLLILACLAILSAGPVLAEQAAPQLAAPAVAIVPAPSAQPSCGQTPDLAGVLAAQGEVCPVAQPKSAAPETLAPLAFGRTCRCSCGQPCKTNADCGGGVCSAGITCC